MLGFQFHHSGQSHDKTPVKERNNNRSGIYSLLTLLFLSPLSHTSSNLLVGFSSPLPGGASGRLPLFSHLKQLPEDLAVFVVDNGSHLKLPLQGINLALEGHRQTGHLHPLLHLLEEINQAI